MHFNKESLTIQLTIKDNIRDILGERLSNRALKYFNINTKTVKSSKIFIILYELSNNKLIDFANLCLKDEIINDVFINTLYNNPIYKSYILVAKLPGVTDDEGISAQKTLSDFLNVHIDTKVQHIFSQELYLIEEKLPNEVLKKLAEELLGNKLINHFEYGTSLNKLVYVPEVQIRTDETIETINLSVTDDELVKLSNNMLLSLNLSEMKAIQNYYKNPKVTNERKKIGLGEDPTDCEIEIFAQTWSEHCKHKEFNAIINFKNLETGKNKTIESLFKTYIKGSTEIIQERLAKSGNNWLIKVFSDNAGVVKINDKSVFVWKVETHNSPSAIDPYGGAITGILGNNRDPMGTGIGGGRFLFNTNVLFLVLLIMMENFLLVNFTLKEYSKAL
jgi:phosphoribosylformylglycinamidine synthase